LIGTAHISEESAALAGRVVREVRPEAVFVELDRKRISKALNPGESQPVGVAGGRAAAGEESSGDLPQSTPGRPSQQVGLAAREESQQEAPRRVNPFDFRERLMEAGTKAVGDAIRGVYSKLNSEGFNPGEEFVLAISEAMKIDAKVVLGDRDVDVTLRRLTEALARTDIKKLTESDSELEQSLKNVMPEDIKSNISSERSLSKDQLSRYVETVKARENVRIVMSQLRAAAPELYNAMVAERDEYMAKGLDSLKEFGSTVAVMGIAHIDGVEGNLSSYGWKQVLVPCAPVR